MTWKEGRRNLEVSAEGPRCAASNTPTEVIRVLAHERVEKELCVVQVAKGKLKEHRDGGSKRLPLPTVSPLPLASFFVPASSLPVPRTAPP